MRKTEPLVQTLFTLRVQTELAKEKKKKLYI